MTIGDLVVRKRDAAATRAALLVAATARFVSETYDNVSLRTIAADAGVDVSLVSRYFGGKEELFKAVLDNCPPPDDLFVGEHADFGERLSRMLLEDPLRQDKPDIFLIMLRSADHPVAAEAVRKSGEERFYGPFERWLGGKNAPERVRLAASIIKGVVMDRLISDDLGLAPEARERFRKKLARVLQAAISE
jgi:AcrR family transcriptional regulator